MGRCWAGIDHLFSVYIEAEDMIYFDFGFAVCT